MQVKRIMYTKLFKVDESASVVEAAKLMKANNVGSLLVQNGSDITGILTEGDIINKVIAEGGDIDKVKVEDVKSYPLVIIDHEADVLEAAHQLTQYHIRRLIVTEKGKPVGIVSSNVIGANIDTILKENKG